MKIAVEELEQQGYRRAAEMDLGQLQAFIMPYLSKINAATILYLVCNLLFVVAVLLSLGIGIKTGQFGRTIGALLAGVLAAFALIPLHEYIHAVAYRLVGARNVSFAADFRKFVFLTIADKFVASKREFFVVALAPFVLISSGSLVLCAFLPAYLQTAIFGMLMMHTLFCIGDFGLVSYFLSQRKKQLVTYDDRTQNQALFYELVKE